ASSATVAELYQRYLNRVGSEVDDWPLWTSSDVTFVSTGPDALRPLTVQPKLEAYRRNSFTLAGYPSDWLVPPAARDLWFRTVTAHLPQTEAANRYWNPIGQYNPACLPGFTTLGGGNGLDGYAAPSITALDGHVLLPTRSLGGYVNSPPLVLTNLSGAQWFSTPPSFTRMPGARFISAIRLKTDVGDRPTQQAQDRLASIAYAIQSATGLDVDIVKGASARPITIALPAGSGGRPALLATEMWSVKGAALRVTRLVDVDSAFLILLSVLASGLVVGETAYVGLRRRQREFATLRGLGWPLSYVVGVVMSEIVLLGLAASAVAIAGIAVANRWSGLPLDWRTLAAVPALLLGVSIIAGTIPAFAVSSGSVSERMAGMNRSTPRVGIRHSWAVAWWDMRMTGRVETMVTALSIGVSGAALGLAILSISGASGALGSSLLDMSTRQHLQQLLVGLATTLVVLGIFGASAVSTTTFINRQPQYAALRAMGWPRSSIATALGIQAGVSAVLGGLIGVSILAAASLVGSSTSVALGALAAAAAVALVAVIPMSFLPVLLIYRRSTAQLLDGP
ncbi:MAG: FtsX-like permease family protein, partial [Candidatus Dormiibacterota bacterium]